MLLQQVQSKAGGPMSQALIDADVARLKEVYRRAGYGLSSVSGRIAPLPNGRSDVVFTVNESGKTGIKSINFEGNEVYSDRPSARPDELDRSRTSSASSRPPTSMIRTGSPPISSWSAASI